MFLCFKNNGLLTIYYTKVFLYLQRFFSVGAVVMSLAVEVDGVDVGEPLDWGRLVLLFELEEVLM